MTNVATRPRVTANPLVQAALDALDAKRATGWRPAERIEGWGAKPGTVDFLGRPIDQNAPLKTILDCSPEDQRIVYFAALSWWIERYVRCWRREEVEDRLPFLEAERWR